MKGADNQGVPNAHSIDNQLDTMQSHPRESEDDFDNELQEAYQSRDKVVSPITVLTKPTTAASFGMLNNNQADFLKAYSSKVRWQAPQTAAAI